ncbi:MAG: DUF1385 domain-containing protein [Clostridiales bacterium]|jgi:uncharacterized protein YqhQ|nr:DUF1385 domain-containing protein [Clostridiales bacterium]
MHASIFENGKGWGYLSPFLQMIGLFGEWEKQMKVKDALKDKPLRQTSIGGQAVLEGVMMMGKNMYALSVRTPDKTIETVKTVTNRASNKYKALRLPIIRGIVSFGSSMITGMRVIYKSAELAGLNDLEEENPSKFDLWLQNKFGDKLYDYIMILSVVIAIVLGIGLFMVLPVGLSSLITPFLGEATWAIGIVEGLMRIVIFLLYMYLISRTKEIQKVFKYHGAEHKTINCFEHQQALTVENVRNNTRLHKRCGTSFLLLVMLVSMVVFFFVRTDVVWIRMLSRILLVPFIAGISYELIRWAGKSDATVVKIISYPGLCLQHLTTLEPDDDQIEVAIAALNGVLEAEPENA